MYHSVMKSQQFLGSTWPLAPHHQSQIPYKASTSCKKCQQHKKMQRENSNFKHWKQYHSAAKSIKKSRFTTFRALFIKKKYIFGFSKIYFAHFSVQFQPFELLSLSSHSSLLSFSKLLRLFNSQIFKILRLSKFLDFKTF